VGSANNAELQAVIPWAGHELSGKDGYLRLTELLFSEFEPIVFRAVRYTDAGAMVFVEGHFTFRHRHTGKIADSDWIARFDMKNHRIVGGQFFENTAAIAAARKDA
jgi:uncharacterized protein